VKQTLTATIFLKSLGPLVQASSQKARLNAGANGFQMPCSATISPKKSSKVMQTRLAQMGLVLPSEFLTNKKKSVTL
jgi:hypothetical protein